MQTGYHQRRDDLSQQSPLQKSHFHILLPGLQLGDLDTPPGLDLVINPRTTLQGDRSRPRRNGGSGLNRLSIQKFPLRLAHVRDLGILPARENFARPVAPPPLAHGGLPSLQPFTKTHQAFGQLRGTPGSRAGSSQLFARRRIEIPQICHQEPGPAGPIHFKLGLIVRSKAYRHHSFRLHSDGKSKSLQFHLGEGRLRIRHHDFRLTGGAFNKRKRDRRLS